MTLARIVPLFGALKGYGRAEARGDLVAGLTTAVMLIPQGMGYAMLAGLPPIYGLYAALLPLVVYGLFGTSRQLAVGPVAMVSLLVAAGVSAIAPAGSESFIAYAILLAAMVGVLQLAMGLGRLGFLVNFLSHPVISGFTSAAALIIGFSQLGHVLGLELSRSQSVAVIAYEAASRLGEAHGMTLAIGGGAVAVLVLLKKVAPTFPAALTVVALSSIGVWALGLQEQGVKIVGAVPDGLPTPSLPLFDAAAIRELFPIALAIALVGFMESIAVAKRYARENRYEVDANRELVGLGLANLAGSVTQAFPVTGGFSRTAVNAQAGARTGLATIITAGAVGLTLLFLTPLFYYLPKAVLAAIIIAAVFSLIDVAEVKHLWQVKRTDLVMLLVTFAATLALGIEEGILVGVGASLAVLVFKTTRPHVALLGRVRGSDEYRNVENFPDAETHDEILAIRLDAQIYFGNVNFLKEALDAAEKTRPAPVEFVVLDASGINQIDASGDAAFREILSGYRERGIELLLATVKGPVRAVLERSGFLDELGRDHLFLRVHDAVSWARAQHDEPVPASSPRRRDGAPAQAQVQG
jgi:sulfate permease, SulP family